MSEAIVPFHRGESARTGERASWPLRIMRLHFALAGIGLVIAALGLGWYVYTNDLDRLDVGWSLRIEPTSDLYAPETQMIVLMLMALAIGAVIELRAVNALRHGEQGGLATTLGALGLLAGFPAAIILWGLELDLPGIPVSTAQQAIRVVAILFAAQSALALWYLIRLARQPTAETPPTGLAGRPLRRLGMVAVGAWLLLVVVLAVVLALATRWIELPVETPEPGALLYTTTFDRAGAEWDLYEGRDTAQIGPTEGFEPAAAFAGALSGDALAITYGSPYSNEVVFSALDRTFGDFDLRVWAQMLSGPLDNQYGVIFRYRDRENYYGFLVGGDAENIGWYALVKMQDGILEFVSNWGPSPIVRPGTAPNEIRIVAVENRFQFFVNDQLVPLCFRGENAMSMWLEGECFTDTPSYTYYDSDFAQGQIALAAGHSIDVSAPVVVAFDDVVIVGPQPELIAPQATAELEPTEQTP